MDMMIYPMKFHIVQIAVASHWSCLAMASPRGTSGATGRGGDVNFAQSGEQGDASANCPGWGSVGKCHRLLVERCNGATMQPILTMNH